MHRPQLLNGPRNLAFAVYARLLLWRLARRLEATVNVDSTSYAIERIRASARDDVERFLEHELDEKERVNAGFKRGTVNFTHPCFAYFAVKHDRETVALFTVQLFGRRVVEDYIAVGRDWRHRGLMNAVLSRFNTSCRELGLLRRIRINCNNYVMRRYYEQRGHILETIEGECFVLELAP